jgi:hypothetical protein
MADIFLPLPSILMYHMCEFDKISEKGEAQELENALLLKLKYCVAVVIFVFLVSPVRKKGTAFLDQFF